MTLNGTERSIAVILAALEAAVAAGDHARALQLEEEMARRLRMEAEERETLERRVRELVERLDVDREQIVPPVRTLTLDGELSAGTPTSDGVVVPVWFGTNRKPNLDRRGFTGDRYDRTTYGRADVSVPRAHRFGESGSSFWKRLRRLDLRDDQLRVTHVEPQSKSDAFAAIRATVDAARTDTPEPQALVFIHGFRNSFEEAAIRAAQISYDLKVPGPTAFFSWPSRGTVHAYTVDEATIEASEDAITEFLLDFTANCGTQHVHVIAHSMGNRGFLRALQRIAADAQTRGCLKFSQIFLAAPDVDRDLFLDLAHLYPEHAARTTIYASHRDLAVDGSSRVHDAPRAGHFLPYTIAAGIDTIAVPNFNVDLLGHSYFAQAEALLHDMYDLIRHNQNPGKRQRMTSLIEGGQTLWSLMR